MAKAMKLNAQDRLILFCTATGIDHAAIGILAHAMQSMAIRGFIAHDRVSGAYTLSDSDALRSRRFLRMLGSRLGWNPADDDHRGGSAGAGKASCQIHMRRNA
jgi:hypothetical protein